MGSKQNLSYVEGINKVIDYIEGNIDKKLTLSMLADVAGFSKYHFHRIFNAYMNETLNSFVMRIRAEKAASILCKYPNKSMTDIAYESGFTDSSAFTKAFKKRFNVTPYVWSKGNSIVDSEYRITEGDITRTNNEFVSASIEYMSDINIAYTRYIGKYAGDGKLFENLFMRLNKWCIQNEIKMEKSKLFCVYHDSINITDDQKLRVTAGIRIDTDYSTDGDIGKLTIKNNNYLVSRFSLNEKQYGDAWKYVYSYLLNEFNVKPASYPCFEMYEPQLLEKVEHNVSICVPIQ